MADINGTNGNDLLTGSSGNDTINSGNGNDTVNAGAGNDTVYAGNGNDIINGGSGMDTLFGENGDDIIDGGTEDDVIDGGNGKDVLFGGAGNDRISGGNGADRIYGGSGNDTIGTATTRCNEDSDENSENGGDLIFGDGYDSYLADQAIIPTGAGANTIAGNDIIFSGNGNDIIWGDNGNNASIGGNDIIYAGKGNDTVYGEGGNDRLMGEAGNDLLNGGAGNDLIVGGLGQDTMTGGTGNDKFVFSAGLSSGDHDEHEDDNHEHHGYDHDNEGNWTDSSNATKDVITDFTAIRDPGATATELDKIDLTQLLGATDLNWGGTTPTANGVWYVKDIPNNVTYVYADINGNSATPELAIKLLGLHDLTNVDFCGVKNLGPVAVADTNAVVEAGGIANALPGSPTASGNVLSNDSDPDFNAVLSVSSAGSFVGTYGTLTLNANGTYTYLLANNQANVQALTQGQVAHDVFNYTVSDGALSSISNLNITVTGTNDAAIISGTSTGTVVEAGGLVSALVGTPTASGILTDTDVDNAPNTFQAVSPGALTANGYGTYAMTAGGTWTYTLNNANASVQALNTGGTLVDSFTVLTADGTSKVVSVTISGANDAAIVSGTRTGTVVEAGGVANVIAGTPTATGILTDTDVDNSANTFQAVLAGALTANGYGTYAMTAGGTWTYTLNNTNASVQALNTGGTLVDSFTVLTADGTSKVVRDRKSVV